MCTVTAKRPLVSVCIPTYNRACMLSGCIESILQQTMTDFEIIVSDNASADTTELVVRSFDDKRIRYVKNSHNVGLRENWNRCLALAIGHYVTIFPDDDEMMPDNLEKKAQVLGMDADIGLVHSKFNVIDADGQVMQESTNWGHSAERTADGMELSEELLISQWDNINATTVMFKMECYDRLGGFADKLNFSLDWEYWMRIAVYYKVFFLAIPLVNWREHAGSCTSHSIGTDQVLKLNEDLLAKKLITDFHVRALSNGHIIKKLIWQQMAERFADVMGDVFNKDKKISETLSFGLNIFYKYPELLFYRCTIKALVKSLAAQSLNINCMATEEGRKMKISILVSASSWGGAEVHTVELARTLEARGHEVSIFEVGSNLYGAVKFGTGVKVDAVVQGDAQLFPGLLGSFRLLKKLKGDVCIFPKPWFPAGNWRLDFAARTMFPRYITIEHSESQPLPTRSTRRHFYNLIPGIGFWWYKAKLDDLLRSSLPHRVVCVSNAVCQELIDYHGFPPWKVTTIHNGVDLARFRPDSESRAAVRDSLGISADARVFGAIGRLDRIKGFDIVIQLFKKLLADLDGNDMWFILVGKGPAYDGLKALSEAADLKGKVKLMGITEASWKIYPAIDVFLMPSRNEGFGLSLIEAMACGCCPIAMGVGGIPEIMTSPSLGWLIEPKDEDSFFEAMKEAALSDPDRLIEMGRVGRQRVVENFQASKQFVALADLIENEASR